MSVNGRGYDWEDITVTLPHGDAAGITEIKYEDGQDVKARYGKAACPAPTVAATTRRRAAWFWTATSGRS